MIRALMVSEVEEEEFRKLWHRLAKIEKRLFALEGRKTVQQFQERVVIEKEELDNKLEKLGTFLTGKIFSTLPEDEQKRLNRQYELMRDYSNVLGERIENFVDGN